jgi:hypothetical protein
LNEAIPSRACELPDMKRRLAARVLGRMRLQPFGEMISRITNHIAYGRIDMSDKAHSMFQSPDASFAHLLECSPL